MVSAVELPVSLPLGLFADTTYTTTSLTMQPGDRLVIVTDGMLEHDAATVDLVATINQTRLLHPTQTARFLTDRVLEAAGDDLADDATVLVLDWHGPPTQANTITNPTSLSETALTPSSTRPQPQQ
jgi:serine/threonine protein phosphatase PrpC